MNIQVIDPQGMIRAKAAELHCLSNADLRYFIKNSASRRDYRNLARQELKARKQALLT